MKVVVRNGVTHGLSRREVENMIQFFPTGWGSAVDSIALYQGSEDGIFVTYHPKERIIGLYWPHLPAPVVSKHVAVEELLIALAVIADSGQLPKKMSSSNRARYIDSTSAVRHKCDAALVAQPGAPGGRFAGKPAPRP